VRSEVRDHSMPHHQFTVRSLALGHSDSDERGCAHARLAGTNAVATRQADDPDEVGGDWTARLSSDR